MRPTILLRASVRLLQCVRSTHVLPIHRAFNCCLCCRSTQIQPSYWRFRQCPQFIHHTAHTPFSCGGCIDVYAAPFLRLRPVSAMSFRGFPCVRLHGLHKCFTKKYSHFFVTWAAEINNLLMNTASSKNLHATKKRLSSSRPQHTRTPTPRVRHTDYSCVQWEIRPSS